MRNLLPFQVAILALGTKRSYPARDVRIADMDSRFENDDASDAITPVTASPASPLAIPTNIVSSDTADTDVASVAVATPAAPPIGERRTIAEVLIENARLLAQVEGRDAIIEELREDRSFLREEVREGRRTRDDVKNIAERMLDTLKTMAVGRLSMSAPPPQDPLQTTYTDSQGHQG